jgi:hypothetical protein
MNLARRLLLSCCAATVLGCGGTDPERPPGSDGAAKVAGDAFAKDGPSGSQNIARTADGAVLPADADASDAPGEEEADAGGADAPAPPRNCSAGHTCTGNTRCQRACFGGLISRCSCAEGHFVCTGCISVDGGVPDLRGGPALCGAGVGHGRRCERAGAVCQQGGDSGQKLCACGDVGPDNLWVCQ